MDRSGLKDCFRDLLEMADVSGVALVSSEGEVLHLAFTEAICPDDVAAQALGPLLERLSGVVEAELVFENGRLYLRTTPVGTLVVVLDPFASIPLVRLQCDVLVPALEGQGDRRGRRRLWGRGRN